MSPVSERGAHAPRLRMAPSALVVLVSLLVALAAFGAVSPIRAHADGDVTWTGTLRYANFVVPTSGSHTTVVTGLELQAKASGSSTGMLFALNDPNTTITRLASNITVDGAKGGCTVTESSPLNSDYGFDCSWDDDNLSHIDIYMETSTLYPDGVGGVMADDTVSIGVHTPVRGPYYPSDGIDYKQDFKTNANHGKSAAYEEALDSCGEDFAGGNPSATQMMADAAGHLCRWAAADAYAKGLIEDDPPAPAYDSVALTKPLPVGSVACDRAGRTTAKQLAACRKAATLANRYDDAGARAAGIEVAIMSTMDRLSAAAAANNAAGEATQNSAFAVYARALSAELAKADKAAAAWISSLKPLHPKRTISARAVTDEQRRLRAGKLPKGVAGSLESEGISASAFAAVIRKDYPPVHGSLHPLSILKSTMATGSAYQQVRRDGSGLNAVDVATVIDGLQHGGSLNAKAAAGLGAALKNVIVSRGSARTKALKAYAKSVSALKPGTAKTLLAWTESFKVPAIATPRPDAGSVTATPASMSSSGGTVTLSTPVFDATSCTYSVTPALNVLPKTVDCSAGKATMDVDLPANTSGNPRSYQFTLTATGPGGDTATPPTTVNQLGSGNPSSLTWTGPNLPDPASGSPTAISCAPGTSATFCMGVDKHGDATSYDGAAWSTPINVDPALAKSRTGLTSVTCPTSIFCAAAGSGDVATFNGTSWSAPTTIDNQALDSVSCSSSSFCVAVDGSDTFTYNGSSWTQSPGAIDSNGTLRSVSCPRDGECFAVDYGGNVVHLTSGTWTAPKLIDAKGETDSISCVPAASPAVCTTVDGFGYSVTLTNTTWGDPVQATGLSLGSISCPVASFCAAIVPFSSDVLTYDVTDKTWSTTNVSEPGNDLQGLSCASASNCVAMDEGKGDAITYDAGTFSWMSADPVLDLTSISCIPSGNHCTAVDQAGRTLAYDGTAWSSPTGVDSAGDLTSVSCPSANFCVAVDGNGNAVSYNGSSWSGPTKIDSTNSLTALSCPSSDFCAAVDDRGNALTYDGTAKAWSDASTVDTKDVHLTSLSCPTATLCMAVDASGYLVEDVDGTWTETSAPIDSGHALTSVSCSSVNFCAAVDNVGQALTWTGGSSWTATSADPGDDGLTAVSCPVDGFCAAVDYLAKAVTLDAGTWSTPSNLGGLSNDLITISCSSKQECEAGGLSGEIFNGTS